MKPCPVIAEYAETFDSMLHRGQEYEIYAMH